MLWLLDVIHTPDLAGTPIETVLNAADDLHLGVERLGTDGPVAMANKKRLLPVPYAVMSSAAADLSVGHGMTVSNDICPCVPQLVIRNRSDF
ncbi:MAG: hypothetical protein ABIJ09_22670 [Pseudomonadota bacterium]